MEALLPKDDKDVIKKDVKTSDKEMKLIKW